MASARIYLFPCLLLTISLCCAPVAFASQRGNGTSHTSSEGAGEGSGGKHVPEVHVAEPRFEEIEVIMVVVFFIMATVLAKIGE